jgi:hypothetical protein
LNKAFTIFIHMTNPPTQALPLSARNGKPISNSRVAPPSQQQLKLAEFSFRLIVAEATRLAPPSGLYNCHGLVFASRRANIPDIQDTLPIGDLLRWDGYLPIREQPVQVGDIAAYLDETGDVEHTGIVCEIDSMGIVPVIWVWSMWGGLGEFRHRATQSPYSQTIQYWRLQ